MALPTAATSSRRPSSPLLQRLSRKPDTITIGLTVALILIAATLLSPPKEIPPLTVINRSDLTVSVQVRSADQSGWMDLGTFGPGRTRVTDVIDQGDSWVVQVSAGSHFSAPYALSRGELRAQRWTLAIPDRALASLRRQGVEPQ